jgi:hypothetical protein
MALWDFCTIAHQAKRLRDVAFVQRLARDAGEQVRVTRRLLPEERQGSDNPL